MVLKKILDFKPMLPEMFTSSPMIAQVRVVHGPTSTGQKPKSDFKPKSDSKKPGS